MSKIADTITRDAALMLGHHPDWRAGQAVFNTALAYAPGIVEELRGTDVDPFNNDDAIPAFLEEINKRVHTAVVSDLASNEEPGTEIDYVALAKEQYQSDGEIEIDDDATVSLSDDGGAYVQAWVWVGQPPVSSIRETSSI